jgi:hypothetical protein
MMEGIKYIIRDGIKFIDHPDTPPPVRDPGEELGITPRSLPAMETMRNLLARAQCGGLAAPPQIIHGLLHRGCKMLLAGTSKSNKSWALLHLGLSVAGGVPWLNFEVERGRVLYINFELPDWSLARRIADIGLVMQGMPEDTFDRFETWNLRGHASDLGLLLPRLLAALGEKRFDLIIIDPLYKLLGDRDENAAGDMGGLFNELERLASDAEAALVVAHHFAKGNAAVKGVQDRMSGSGVMARDVDALMVLTPHEEEDAFTAEFVVRHFARVQPFAVRWVHPLLTPDASLDPDQLKGSVGAPKKLTSQDVLDVIGSGYFSRPDLIEKIAAERGISPATARRRIDEAEKSGKILNSNGLLRIA